MTEKELKRNITLCRSVILTLLLLLFNCEGEELKTSNNKPNLNAKSNISKVFKQNIFTNKKLKKQLKVLEKNMEEQKAKQKTVTSEVYDFSINTDYATYIENPDGSNHSYTFTIVRDIETEFLENLVLSSKNNGSYAMYLVTYSVTTQEKEDLKNGMEVDLTNKVSYTSINDEGLIFDVFSKETVIVCLEIAISYCTYDNPLHSEGYDDNNEKCPGYSELVVGTAGNCDSSSNGNTNTTSTTNTTDSSDTNTNTTDDTTNPNGGGLNTYNIVATSPTMLCTDCFEYDEECELSDEEFNAPFTTNSPFNVDLAEIRSSCDNISLPENEKFICIYRNLTQSPSFKNLFIDTFGESENLNVKFTIDNTLPNGVGARTGLDPDNPSTIIDGVSHLNFIIKINQKYLENDNVLVTSNIDIAKNILHECIHAFLYVKKYNCNDGTTIDYLDNQLLGELLNEYYDGACSDNQEQHEFMFNYMLPVMVAIMEDVKDDLIPVSNQNQVTDLDYNSDLYPGNPFTESHLFDWNEFYEYLSIAGLHNTNTFQQHIASDQIKNYLFYRYAGGTNGTVNQFSKTYCDE